MTRCSAGRTAFTVASGGDLHGEDDLEDEDDAYTAHSNDFRELCYSETELLLDIIG